MGGIPELLAALRGMLDGAYDEGTPELLPEPPVVLLPPELDDPVIGLTAVLLADALDDLEEVEGLPDEAEDAATAELLPEPPVVLPKLELEGGGKYIDGPLSEETVAKLLAEVPGALLGDTEDDTDDDPEADEPGPDPVTGLTAVLLLRPVLDDLTNGTDEDVGVGVISDPEEYELIDTVPEVPEAGRLLPGAPGPLEAGPEGAGPEEVGGRIPELMDLLDGGISPELVDPLGAECELPEDAVTGLAGV